MTVTDNNQSLIPSADMIQLTLTLKMAIAQVVEISVTVVNNSPIQDYVHPDDHTQPTYELTPGLKLFTVFQIHLWPNQNLSLNSLSLPTITFPLLLLNFFY